MPGIKQFVKNSLAGFFSRLPFKLGSGESTAIFGKQAGATGDFSIASGTSTTSAADRVNLDIATDAQIISEWEASDPDTDKFSLAKGEASHVEGNNCLALGNHSHAEGNGTIAGDNSSHSEGTGSKAIGKYAHAEGLETEAEGSRSHTEGAWTKAIQDEAHAEGQYSEARARASHAEGYKSVTSKEGYSSNTLEPHAQGTGTSSWVNGISHAEGNATIAQGLGAHAEGEKTFANNRTAHAEGLETVASGDYASHAEGEATIASGEDSHAEGFKTKAAALASHTEGNRTVINEGGRSHTEGYGTYATGVGAHSEGINGYFIVLQRNGSSGNVYNIRQIEGMTPEDALAAGKYPKVGDLNAEDSKSIKSVDTANHRITMSGNWGGNNKWHRLYFIINDIEDTSLRNNDGALNFAAHAEGVHTKANGWGSHAEGEMTVANGDTSHAEGWRTKTENQCEHAQGQYNVSHKASGTFGDAGNTIHSVGIGNRTDNYGNGDNKNAFEIMQNGDAYLIGIGGYDGTTITGATPLQSSIAQKAASNVVSLSSSDSDTDVFVGPYRTNANYIFVLENVGQPVTYIGFITDGNEGGNSFDVKGNIPPEIRYDKVVCDNGDCYCRINYHNIPQYAFSTNVTVTNLLGDYVEIIGSSDNLPSISSTTSGYYGKSYFNGVAVPGIVSQTLNWSADNSSYTTSNVTWGPIPASFIDLVTTNRFVTFNSTTGYFSLNGLTDLSYDEMKYIYVNGNYPLHSDYSQYSSGYLGRTIMPVYLHALSSKPAMFSSCSNLEVVGEINNMGYNNLIVSSASNNITCVSGCSKFKKWLYPIYDNYNRVANRSVKFVNCPNLIYVNTYAINSDYYLKESPKIPYSEFKRWLDKTSTSSPATSATRSVTIYVHPDTMSYLNGTVTPPEELGGTSAEWQALVTQAQTYLINFATS